MKNILKNAVAYYKNNKAKTILVSIVIILGLIFAWYITVPLIIVVFLWTKFSKEDKQKIGQKKQCQHCLKEIEMLARRCPHCRSKTNVWDAKTKITGVIIVIITIFIISSIMGKDNSSVPTASNETKTEIGTIDPVKKAKAEIELKELMELGIKSGLVTSYEFSTTANVVYVGAVWYTQTVEFKKDFIAKIGLLKKDITGYTHYQLRDTYNNEKVGEITAFMQSIEVYK